jgi:hypothetical protein
MDLLKKLQSLKPQMAAAAQQVIDSWEQDEEGIDEEFGSGGACDKVSEAIVDVMSGIEGVEFTDGGHDGDDHAYPIVYDDSEAYAVDIPPGVYETGSGYQWKKIDDAQITAGDIIISEVDRDLIVDWD